MIVRDVRLEDAAGLRDLFRALLVDGRGVVQTLDDLDDEATFRRRIEERSDAIWVVGEEDGRVVGEGTIGRLRATLLSHVGILAMGVHPEAQRRGIGRRILRALVERARAAGIIRLELYTRADNHRARALYGSEGFVHESTRRRLVRTEEGQWIDDHIMVRFLDES